MELQHEARLYPDKVRIESEPHTRLAALRRDNLEQVIARLRVQGRVPRVCRYALSVGGHWPSNSLDAAAAFAVLNSWKVGGEKKTFTDHHGSPDPELRAGWCEVRNQIRAGYADGVVVTTTSVISRNADEYERQLHWFHMHCAFVAVIAPTAYTGRL
ncbi:recombinase family protein [Streptomyces sp. 35G-GA-8]|uniref:recombinase family protein n=1 Tax=Streptomyces sp. 35G-GA-8 TaxID=2939434 RepID=UPI00201EBD29|nr:recombinase family protein [Streptomyces sp. 35G-GA-8]MCL7377001.1 recombinase family protein [Streptomyces sp. 35G-GA-8]